MEDSHQKNYLEAPRSARNVRLVKADRMSRKGCEVSGNKSCADREASTADCLSGYKLAACARPGQAAILEITSVVYKLEIALLSASVESSAISLLGGSCLEFRL